MASTSSYSSGTQIQIRFITKQDKYSVADTPFAVPCSIVSDELNALLKELLNESSSDDAHKSIIFDFAISSVLLRQALDKHISEVGLSTENIIDIEYFEKFPSPEPEDCLMHDDWVSSVQVRGDWILSGCYDNNVYLWTKKGKHILTIPGHTGAVKSVAWVSQNNGIASFVSASHDQTAMLWEWNMAENSVECVHVCRGHERSLESVAVDERAERFATGGWDSLLKVWSASLHRTDDNSLEETSSKKSKKTSTKSQTREKKKGKEKEGRKRRREEEENEKKEEEEENEGEKKEKKKEKEKKKKEKEKRSRRRRRGRRRRGRKKKKKKEVEEEEERGEA
ncbi:hypothetical protein LSTR_LSTR007118 [Laodelphax striatellus]|uniref:NLE domain-containing protein n=1 Tax=Laodelphax striatellus TaxID=195883 RepID=A0A482XGK6_LAOST|nr:hypothetical protein LSTR_LSTR007118 [Laodelphax striatellus]